MAVDLLINLMVEIFQNLYMYQIIMLYTLSILHFICEVYANETEK